MKEYLPRIADSLLMDQLECSGAVLIEGPKWCGKTTTALNTAKTVVKMDDPDLKKHYLEIAQLQPSLLLKGDNPLLIDEWQVAPNLWDAVRYEVDKRGEPGQFILTGSSVPEDTDEDSHSGTGRFARVKMRSLSLYESKKSNGTVSLSDLFKGKEPSAIGPDDSLEDIATMICRGGWPSSVSLSDKAALRQMRNYYESLVMQDVPRAKGVEKLETERARRILRSYARNVAQSLPLETIREDVIANDEKSFSQGSLYRYISFLKRIFILEDVSAWNPNLRSKTAVRTADTRYFVDPSIGCAALGIGPNDLLNDLNFMGFLFENLVIRDIRTYAEFLDGDVYHYRDKSGLECDAVIHLRNGKYGLIEVKLGSEEGIREGIKSLNALENKIDIDKMTKPSFKMILIAKGKYAYRNEEGIDIVPLTCLKP